MKYAIAFYVDSVPFTPGVIAGTESLGGSESACLGLARALRGRGHDVHIFATQLDEACEGRDQCGVVWHPAVDLGTMSQYLEWDLVCVLRMAQFFAGDLVNARLRWLWNQDLLQGDGAQHLVMASAFQVDRYVYVSQYHRHQWEAQLPALAPLGWVTKNGYDPALVPTDVTKRPNRLIHISRPERGLSPLLRMWPAVRARVTDAELAICRYNSMYDARGWGQVCAAFDAQVDRVNERVGGIVRLGELGKPALYEAIAESAAMWYPGIASFAETSCIAAIEAQACGTPFVGSARGALPETVPSGILLKGDAEHDEAYQTASVDAVCQLIHDCAFETARYRALQKQGLAWVTAYTYDRLAAEWEQAITDAFETRARTSTAAIARRLLHDDDHVAALSLATTDARVEPAVAEFCRHVIAGHDHGPKEYGERALPDPIAEGEGNDRFALAIKALEGCTSVLDVACGNGAFALLLARTRPDVRVHALDYSEHNIEVAQAAAERLNVTDRVTFRLCSVYDFERQTMTPAWEAFAAEGRQFDGLFVGEFLEHVAAADVLIDGLEAALTDGATVVYTVPNGPLTELMGRGIPIHRGHVHRFAHDDLTAVFGGKAQSDVTYLAAGWTARQRPVGHWLIRYQVNLGRRAGRRPIADRVLRTRPYPRLSVGLIIKNAEADLARCLDSVWSIADEIVIGDAGSTDKTVAIAESFGARVLPLAPVDLQPEGFAGARNQVLNACTGEWFLWIDADEVLIGKQELAKYLDPGGPHMGYVIRQQHLYLDLPSSYDIPVRLFRRVPEIRFYGCIHEQPAMGDCNTDIFPALELRDVTIAHYGYLTEEIRKAKMFRNLPMLKRDAEVFPERQLGRVLVLRDYVNLADHERATMGRWTPRAAQWCQYAVAIYDQHFTDPAHKLHLLARPWYEKAIQNLHQMGVLQAIEMEIGLGGAPGGLNGTHPSRDRVWVRSGDEFARIMAYKTEAMTKLFAEPVVDTRPWTPEPAPLSEVA